MKLGVIDYGAGNLKSVRNSFQAIGVDSVLVQTSDEMDGLTHLVLPGVGAFGDCCTKLRTQGLVDALKAWIASDRPFLGICIGYQALFESSEESPGVEGLGIFKGAVVRFPESNLKIPHMGWNSVHLKEADDPMWEDMGQDPFFYYVHSYFPQPTDASIVAAETEYGVKFAAAIRQGRLTATQFHPEKSQKMGLTLLRNFVSL
jgi:glutamine amidotransferase